MLRNKTKGILALVAAAMMIVVWLGSESAQDHRGSHRSFPEEISTMSMRFSVVETTFDPDKGRRVENGQVIVTGLPDTRLPEQTWIRADGFITPETPLAFAEFLERICHDREICEPGDQGVHTIGFNSNGGNLLAAMELGREIRTRGFRTALVSTPEPFSGSSDAIQSGTCLSACAYAFLGGVHRRLQIDYSTPDTRPRDINERGLPRSSASIIGVHRFRRDGSALAEALADGEVFVATRLGSECAGLSTIELAQCVDGKLIEYVAEMGVDPAFLVSAATRDSSEIALLGIQSLRDMRVLNDRAFIDWRRDFETSEIYRYRSRQPIALVSESEDRDAAINRVSFFCAPEGGRRIAFSSRREGVLTGQGTAGDNADVWIVTIGDDRLVFSPANTRYAGFDGRGYLYLAISDEDWDRAFSNGPTELVAFKASELDMPEQQRIRAEAILDGRAIQELAYISENRCGQSG